MQALASAVYPVLGAVLISFICAVNAEDGFQFPPMGARGPLPTDFRNNLVWTIGQPQTIRWTWPHTDYTVGVFQLGQIHDDEYAGGILTHGMYLDSLYEVDRNGVSGDHEWVWNVPDPYETYAARNHSDGLPIFYLGIMNLLTDGPLAAERSAYFNLTTEHVDPTSAISSSASASRTSTVTSSPTPSDTGVPRDETSSGTDPNIIKVGLGVGLGVGIPLVLIAGIWVGLKASRSRRRSRRSSLERVEATQSVAYIPPEKVPDDERARYRLSELPVTEARPGADPLAELDGSETTRHPA